MSEVSIKFTLQRKSGKEIRRIHGDYTFASLQSVMRQWWGASRLRWQYNDPMDGEDLVTLSTELEWRACITAHQMAGRDLVRLIIIKSPQGTETRNSAPTLSSNAEEPAAAQAIASDEDVPEASPVQQKGCETVPPVLDDAAIAQDVKVEGAYQCNVLPDGTQTESCTPSPILLSAAQDLIEIMYGSDALLQLMRGDVDNKMLGVATVIGRTCGGVWSPRRRVEVDVDVTALAREAIVHGCDALQRLDYDAAYKIFSTSLLLPLENPKQASLLNYNMACVCALQSDSSSALRYLDTAVELGFSNGAHMFEDSDLQSLHGCPEFDGILMRAGWTARPKPSTPVVPTLALPNQTETPAIPATAASDEESTPVSTLMSIFPGTDAATAKEVLAHAAGNLQRAVEMFLGK